MSLEEWLKALLEIVEDREETMKQKLFGDNAKEYISYKINRKESLLWEKYSVLEVFQE